MTRSDIMVGGGGNKETFTFSVSFSSSCGLITNHGTNWFCWCVKEVIEDERNKSGLVTIPKRTPHKRVTTLQLRFSYSAQYSEELVHSLGKSNAKPHEMMIAFCEWLKILSTLSPLFLHNIPLVCVWYSYVPCVNHMMWSCKDRFKLICRGLILSMRIYSSDSVWSNSLIVSLLLLPSHSFSRPHTQNDSFHSIHSPRP